MINPQTFAAKTDNISKSLKNQHLSALIFYFSTEGFFLQNNYWRFANCTITSNGAGMTRQPGTTF